MTTRKFTVIKPDWGKHAQDKEIIYKVYN